MTDETYAYLRRPAAFGGVLVRRASLLQAPIKQLPSVRKMRRAGTAYLAGESPGGTTTVEGVPEPAEIRAIWRGPDGHWADGLVAGRAFSDHSGTWRIDNLNPDLRYDVVGRKDGFNDVIMANIKPAFLSE